MVIEPPNVDMQEPTPPSLEEEEKLLRIELAKDGSRLDLAQRLCDVLTIQGMPVPPELESMGLAALLTIAPDRADLAVRLAYLIRQQNTSLETFCVVDGWCLSTDPQTRSLEPFVFLHIPKTAGSIIRLIILSLFDTERVFPGWNYTDYDTVTGFSERILPDNHGVFIGHMIWNSISAIEAHFQQPPVVCTMLRDPVSNYRSQVAFIDTLVNNGVTTMNIDGHDVDTSAFWDRTTREEHLVSLFELQSISLLGTQSPHYSRLETTEVPQFVPSAPSVMEAARAVLSTRLRSIELLIFEDFRRSLDLMCHDLVLPYQFIPDLRLNSSAADHSVEMTDGQRARLDDRDPLCFELDAEARGLFERNYADRLGPIADVREHLDNRYIAQVLEKLKPVWCAELDASRAWPGFGWGFRESNSNGQNWRDLGFDGRATILARLRTGCDFWLSLTVYSADSDQTLGDVTALANGQELVAQGLAFIDGAYVLSWLVPAAGVSASDGEMRLDFRLLPEPGRHDAKLSVSKVVIYPITVAQYP